MDSGEINLRDLKRAIVGLLDHVMEDLGVEKVAIEQQKDFYWSCPPPERYDTSKRPSEWWTGRLSDDLDFIQNMLRTEGYISHLLVHAAPLLRYVGETIRECGRCEDVEPPKSN